MAREPSRQPSTAPGYARDARNRPGGRRAQSSTCSSRIGAPGSTTGSPAVDSFPEGFGHPRRYRPAEIGKNRRATSRSSGRKPVMAELIDALSAEHAVGRWATTRDWWDQRPQEAASRWVRRSRNDEPVPQYVISRLGEIAGRTPATSGRRSAPDVGLQFIGYENPHLAQLRRPGHHGLRHPGGHGRESRLPRGHGLGIDGDGCFPDDQPGTGHLHHQRHPRSRWR